MLVGEPHGVEQTPRVLYTLVRRLGLRGLALEWAEEELEDLDLERLWQLPADAELFSGDGRITAGHFALIEGLRRAARLDQLVLLDRVGSVSPERERGMAEQLRRELRPGIRLLAVVGAGHLTPGAPLREAFPEAPVAVLDYRGGSCFFNGVRALAPLPELSAIRLTLGAAAPAVVPVRD